MKKKQVVSILLASVMALSMTACGGSSSSDSAATDDKAATDDAASTDDATDDSASSGEKQKITI